MIIEVYDTISFSKRYFKNGKKVTRMKIRCDYCDNVVERKYISEYATKFFFCCRNCCDESRKPGGLIHDKIINTQIEKFGCIASKLDWCKEKQEKTNQEKYGFKSTAEHPHVNEKARITCRERYGGDGPQCSEKIKEKKANTNLQRYGVKNILEREDIKKKINSIETKHKAHETMKLNNTYRTSKIENKCYEMLCDIFTSNDVERQKWLYKWPIDFYIKSLDLYVQFDGVYWHGLDRPLNEIKQFKNPRDKSIYRKFCIDRTQEKYCEEHNVKMLRATTINEIKDYVTNLIFNLNT